MLFAVLGALPLQGQTQGKPPVSAPFAKGPKMTTEQALQQAAKTNPALASFDKSFKSAEATLKKKPKDAKAKKAYVEACYKYGHEAMVSGQASPKVMYRAALALFRRALKVDPKHKASLDEKKMIEDIYKTMPGGIPQ